MFTMKFGNSQYLVYGRDELIRLGLVDNPNQYNGNSWRFCPVCAHYSYIDAMSWPGHSESVEVCRDCNMASRNPDRPIENPNRAFEEYQKTFPYTDDPRR